MDDVLQNLIECKLKLAEAQDTIFEQETKLKHKQEHSEMLNFQISTLLRKISTLKEKNRFLKEEHKSLKKILAQYENNFESFRCPESFLSPKESELSKLLKAPYKKIKSIKLKKIVEMGIPSNERGKFWSEKIGNELHITSRLYEVLLETGQEALWKTREENGSNLIPLDLMRTLGSLKVFQENQPLNKDLNSLLEAFAAYRPDIGYVQGMAYIGAVLILHLGLPKAFEAFANLILSSELLRSFYSFDMETIHEYYKVFEYLLRKKVPNVYERFERIGITPDMYLLEWVYTIYGRCFPIETVRWLVYRESFVGHFPVVRRCLYFQNWVGYTD